MIRGMTGFGRAQGSGDWGSWTWEVRSVNGKSVDGRVSVPNGCEAIEFEARKRLKARFNRGSFQLQLRIDLAKAGSDSVRLNDAQMLKLARVARSWSGGRAAGALSADAVAQLLAVPGSVEAGRRSMRLSDEAAAQVLESLSEAFGALEAAREVEGAALSELLTGMLTDMDARVGDASGLAAKQPGDIRAKFEVRLKELGADLPIDEERVAQEVLVMANKADVREELDRLVAHTANAREILASGAPAGRKLDFLCQELNRETNTLCSKSASLELTNTGLALKSLIDQFREQVQNVE